MTTPRADLLALTPTILARLANVGLVKRAEKALAGGDLPTLDLAADGTLAAQFADGHSVHWANGQALDQSRCTCPAPVCRHRVQAALAYRAVHDNPHTEVDSPHLIDDTELAAWSLPQLVRQADALCANGLAIELRGTESGEECPTARLPMATVRFWGGSRLNETRCDCAEQSRCAHILLAVRAWRTLPADQPAPARHTVHLPATREATPPASPEARIAAPAADGQAATDPATAPSAAGSDWPLPAPERALLDRLWRHGLVHGADAFARALADARAAAEAQRAVWIMLLLDDLDAWIAAYHARAGHFQPRAGVRLLGELALRRLAAADGAPASQRHAALGTQTAFDTPLATARLVTLGCRIQRDGEDREAQIIVADLATQTRMTLSERWQVSADATPADEAALRARQRVAPRIGLAQMANGQLVATRARRLANHSLQLFKGRHNANQVLPQNGDWTQLAAPIRYTTLAALRAERVQQPQRALAPRLDHPDFVVLAVRGGQAPLYDPALQVLGAVLHDLADEPEPLLVQRQHRAHVPQALDALAAALADPGLHHVAGVLHWHGGHAVLDPWAVAGSRLCVPDLADGSGVLATTALTDWEQLAADTPHAALHELLDWLSDLLVHGSHQRSGQIAQGAHRLAPLLADAGFHHLAAVAERAPTEPEAALTTLAAELLLHLDAAAREA